MLNDTKHKQKLPTIIDTPDVIIIIRSSQCSMTKGNKGYVLSFLWDDAYKRILAANRKE